MCYTTVEGDVDLLASDEYWDPHAIAGLLKSFLRELPASILTRELHLRFLAVIGTSPSLPPRLTFLLTFVFYLLSLPCLPCIVRPNRLCRRAGTNQRTLPANRSAPSR